MTTQHEKTPQEPAFDDLQRIAGTFVSARRNASSLDEYPGSPPANLDVAYQVQDMAIDLWPDDIAGWKVGRIPPALEDEVGCDRLGGPIFARSVRFQDDGAIDDMPIFAGGFAAVEAEFVAIIRDDAADEKLEWSRAEAEAMIGELRIGLEVASSPLGVINDLGPAVTASDFGNNAGLVVGPAIDGWRERDPDTLTSATWVDGELAGEGGAFGLTGGVARSVQFMLELAASRGRPLRAGQVIATGQTTGIHDVTAGQSVRIVFGGGADGEISCRLVRACGG